MVHPPLITMTGTPFDPPDEVSAPPLASPEVVAPESTQEAPQRQRSDKADRPRKDARKVAPDAASSVPATSATGAGAPSAAAGSAPTGSGSGAADGMGPMATASLQALAMMAAQFGQGQLTAPAFTPLPTPPDLDADAISGTLWDDPGLYNGNGGSAGGMSRRAAAMEDINQRLAQILTKTQHGIAGGRVALANIQAEVDASLTALGTVSDTAASRARIAAALQAALGRAHVVVNNNDAASALDAAEINTLADEFARESAPHASGGGSFHRSFGGPPLAMPSGNERIWIDQALEILRENGYAGQIDPADVAAIIQHESAGNPHAINLWDSNAAAGHPSIGLMQTIGPTFAAHALPGHNDIWNPVDNIIAGVRYAVARYGSLSNVPGIVRLHEGMSYVGY